MKPLRGLSVVELAPHFPGQYLCQALASLGATVTKVEPPEGDSGRRLPPFVNGIGFAFAAANAGKRLVRLDLRRIEGRRRMDALLERADLFVCALRPASAGPLGVSPARCRRINPKLVVLQLVGWGVRGPWRDRVGHDLAYQALAGCVGSDRAPRAPTTQTADLLGALWGALCSVAALAEARRRGQGRSFAVSLAGSALAGSLIARALAAAGASPEILGGDYAGYRLYRCADRRWLAVALLEPEWAERLGKVVGVPRIPDVGASKRRRGSDARMVARRIRARPRDYWLRRLRAARLPAAPVVDATRAPKAFAKAGVVLPPHKVSITIPRLLTR